MLSSNSLALTRPFTCQVVTSPFARLAIAKQLLVFIYTITEMQVPSDVCVSSESYPLCHSRQQIIMIFTDSTVK